jgi:heme/copper-type cytochrome/quinol oxidase subunit 2
MPKSAGSDLASFGRVYAMFSAFTATLIAVIFIVLGIVVYRSKANPKEPDPEFIGSVMIVIGIIVILLSWGMVYFTQKSKLAAQGEGVLGGVSILNSITGNGRNF